VDPRLRAAVDTSLAWYADVFALHGIPTRVEDGVWWALEPPPPWHSDVKTTEPGVDVARVLAVQESGAVADSFGDLDLTPHGFTVLIEATWVHHHPLDEPPAELPHGWTVVRDPGLLAEWNEAHDYAGVLVPAVLADPAFAVLARHVHGALVGGAVVHRGDHRHAVVGLSNGWSADSWEIDHGELLEVVGALHPDAGVTDYAWGDDLEAMVAAGYEPLGPQRVWTPPRPVAAPWTTGSFRVVHDKRVVIQPISRPICHGLPEAPPG
jgi:hypothetical protein